MRRGVERQAPPAGLVHGAAELQAREVPQGQPLDLAPKFPSGPKRAPSHGVLYIMVRNSMARCIYDGLSYNGLSYNGLSYNGAPFNGALRDGASFNAALYNGAPFNMRYM